MYIIFGKLTSDFLMKFLRNDLLILKHFSVLTTLIASVLLSYPIWPCIFDILLPINETRPHPPPLFVTEYFVDQERYFYLIILHANAAFAIGGAALLAIGTMMIVYIQYACGMFRIAR